MKIPKEDFETQEQQQDRMKLLSGLVDGPTLFKAPIVLFGQTIHWIDAKNSLVVPGLSPDKIVYSMSKQMKTYTETFGPGAILWTKCGFSQLTQEWLQSEFEVLSVRPLGYVPHRNAMNDSDKGFMRHCQICRIPFNFSHTKQIDFNSKGWKYPKRCRTCPK
jgi:hypothetical protein